LAPVTRIGRKAPGNAPAYVKHTTGLYLGAVRRDDSAQLRDRQSWTMFHRQAVNAQPPDTPAALRLFKAMRRDRDDLFRFVTRRDVSYTTNACERALRPSVIFRKVTGCFRSQWGAEVYAAAASVIATGRIYGLTALQALRNALASLPIVPQAR
jgi:Transposase IS66 family